MPQKLTSLPENLQNVTRFNVQITDVEPVNELFSKCSIRILYPGLNANDVYIEREVADSMVKSLYNIPIVGEYIETVEDFKDHGGKIEITTDDIKFIETTKPYGFVPEGTHVEWQEITEEDGTVREYLTCVGYLWTGRYPETQTIINEGRPQSMELDEDTLEGYWKREEGQTFFYITKAQFSALCILGKDVPPAFESAHIGSYYLSNPISFRKRLGKLIRELEETVPDVMEQKVANFSSAKDNKEIKNDKGGQNMNIMNFALNLEQDNIRHQAYCALNTNSNDNDGFAFDYSVVKVDDDTVTYTEEATGSNYIRNYTTDGTGPIVWTQEPQEVTLAVYDNSELEDLKQEYSKLEQDHAELQQQYTNLKEQSENLEEFSKLQEENKELKDFKATIELQEKKAVITEFKSLLSEEDIQPVEDKINEFTKEEIEAKLAVLAIRKTDFTKRVQDDLVPNNDDLVDDGKAGWEKIVERHNK